MAKVTAPLMSFSACGTVGGIVQYRMVAGRAIVSAPTIPTDKRTWGQDNTRQRAADAARTWNELATPAKGRWATIAVSAGLPTFALYLREFINQRCWYGDAPKYPIYA